MTKEEWERIDFQLQTCPDGDGPSTMALPKFLMYALDASLCEPDHRRDRPGWLLFDFARYMRGHPDLEKLTASEAWRKIRPLIAATPIDEEEDPSAPRDPFGYFFDLSEEDAQSEFYGAWDRVRLPRGLSPLRAAKRKADSHPIELPERVRTKRPPGYARFIAAVGWLQTIVGRRPIKLPRKAVAKEWGMSVGNVSNYVKWAREDGFIIQSAEEVPRVYAACYFCDVSRCRAWLDAAEPGTMEEFERVRRGLAGNPENEPSKSSNCNR